MSINLPAIHINTHGHGHNKGAKLNINQALLNGTGFPVEPWITDDCEEDEEDDKVPIKHELAAAMEDVFNDNEQNNFEFQQIVGHIFDKGILILKVQFEGDQVEQTFNVPFDILKKDEPLSLACYI